MTGSFILGNDSTHQKLWSMHQKKSYKAHRADVGNCDFFLVLVDELELRKWDLPSQTPPGHKRMGRPGSILRSPLLTKLAEFSLCRLPERRQGSGWDLGREDQYQNLCTWRGCGITTILRQEPRSHSIFTLDAHNWVPNSVTQLLCKLMSKFMVTSVFPTWHGEQIAAGKTQQNNFSKKVWTHWRFFVSSSSFRHGHPNSLTLNCSQDNCQTTRV